MFHWNIKKQDPKAVALLTGAGIHPVVARLLCNRGFQTPEQALPFLQAGAGELHAPGTLPDIEKACARIEKAVRSGEKVTVYGDYDVDGITSVVMLCTYLRSRGLDAGYYIPDRKEEGYGLNLAAVEKIRAGGSTLVITVDTGTTAVKEVAFAKSAGLEMIITDHHECSPVLPDCLVVNPKRPDSAYPFSELAGAGVVFKLLCALEGDLDAVFDRYGALAAIGTVADIMPLVGENRVLVSKGLERLKNPPPGLCALVEASGSGENTINTGMIAYRLAPRLNAAGRIGNPSVSVDLLLAEDGGEAKRLALVLCEENTRRQQIEAEILEQVEARIEACGKLDNIIVEASEGWHSGVIGIVASRIVEKYGRPCILFSLDNGKAKGSARSVKGVNMFALLQENAAYLTKFGGHEMAAGLTLPQEDYSAFRTALVRYANRQIDPDLFTHVFEAECLLCGQDIRLALFDSLKILEPYGCANPAPVFAARGLRLVKIDGVSQNKHTRLTFETETVCFGAMFFGRSPSELSCREGDFLDILFTVGENIFRGNRSLSVTVKSMRLPREMEDSFFSSQLLYGVAGELPETERLDRETVAVVYKYIKNQNLLGVEKFSPIGLCRRISTALPGFTLCRLRLCLDIFAELKLCDVSYYTAGAVSEDTLVKIQICNTKKTSLENSSTFQKVCVRSHDVR